MFNRHIDDRDRLMNKWRRTDSAEMAAIVNNVAKQLENYERYFGLRQRERKAADRAVFMACVEALTCDLIHRALTSENMLGRIAVSMDRTVKAGRYKAPCDSKQFPQIVHLMAAPEMGFLGVCELGGWQIGKRTAVRAGGRLKEWIDYWGIEVTDLRLDGDEEIVIQKRGKYDPMNTVDGRAEWIDYPESNMSKKYRREVRTINEWLHKAQLDYSGGRLVDLSDKRLRRYFNNASFKEGGRLFGGFWQWLKSRQVRHITINGERIAEVDFETMQVALARASVGHPHDIWKDAYMVPGFEQYRAGIKRVFASMLFAQKPLKRWPRDVQCLFPPGTSILSVCEAIEKAFPELSDLWYVGAGFRLMFTESQVLVQVLLRLIERGVVALPKHDCVLVPEKKAALAAKVMQETFEELTGGPVGLTVNGKRWLKVM